MPDGTPPIHRDAGSNGTERLNSAIDRMLSSGPTPVLNDPELHSLLQLAARLHDELPHDLPDPVFRLNLKQQLTASGPVPVARTRVQTPARFPWVAAVSAIAAVMLAAVSVGTLGIWLNSDSSDPGQITTIGNVSPDQLTATTIGMVTATAELDPANARTTAGTTPPGNPSSMTTIQPAGDATEDADETPGTDPVTQATATDTVPSTRTVESVSTPEPTTAPVLAAVPPVDDQHLEQGPKPAADGGGGAPSNVSYVLDTTLPDLGAAAEIFRLVPPRTDPETFVETVAQAMNIEGDVISDVPQGRTVYHLFDDDTGSFHWTPETGAFTLALTDDNTSGPLPMDRVAITAREWLAEIGYPVELLDTEIQVESFGDSGWRLEAHYAGMPEIGLGHPLGVTVFVAADGTVTEATGYWLNVKQVDTALLLPASEIWQAISEGRGIWTGGGIVEAGGEFRAESMRISYILTRDPSGDLVLQPVVQTSGEFTTADGLSSARISCFVQAARTTTENSP